MDANDVVTIDQLADTYAACMARVNTGGTTQQDPVELLSGDLYTIPRNMTTVLLNDFVDANGQLIYDIDEKHDEKLIVFPQNQDDNTITYTVQGLLDHLGEYATPGSPGSPVVTRLKFVRIASPIILVYNRVLHGTTDRLETRIEPSLEITIDVLEALSDSANGDQFGRDVTNHATKVPMQLSGVVCHMAGETTNGGHYTYWQRFPDGWRYFDDARVSPPHPTIGNVVTTGCIFVYR